MPAPWLPKSTHSNGQPHHSDYRGPGATLEKPRPFLLLHQRERIHTCRARPTLPSEHSKTAKPPPHCLSRSAAGRAPYIAGRLSGSAHSAQASPLPLSTISLLARSACAVLVASSPCSDAGRGWCSVPREKGKLPNPRMKVFRSPAAGAPPEKMSSNGGAGDARFGKRDSQCSNSNSPRIIPASAGK